MPYVPQGQFKDGTIYGDKEIRLTECTLCENVYAVGAEDAHATTPAHAAAKAAQKG